MTKIMIALATAGALCAFQAHAEDYIAGDAWGTGTDDGVNRAAMHATYGQNGVRLKQGSNLTSSQIYSIGTNINLGVNGDNNNVSGNGLNGTNSDSPVSTNGQINGGNGGDVNPFAKTKK